MVIFHSYVSLSEGISFQIWTAAGDNPSTGRPRPQVLWRLSWKVPKSVAPSDAMLGSTGHHGVIIFLPMFRRISLSLYI